MENRSIDYLTCERLIQSDQFGHQLFSLPITRCNKTNLFIAQLGRIEVTDDLRFRSLQLCFRTCLQNVIHVFPCFCRERAFGNRGKLIPAKHIDRNACNSHAIRNCELDVSKGLLYSSQKHRANCGEQIQHGGGVRGSFHIPTTLVLTALSLTDEPRSTYFHRIIGPPC